MSGSWVGRAVTSPKSYVAAAAVVVAVLAATAFGNPWVFGFAAIGALWLTVGLTLLGLVVVVASRRLSRRSRLVIVIALVAACAAVAVALRYLGTFNWA